eukprot:8059896-Alexandrium_andersonii.AAC.1
MSVMSRSIWRRSSKLFSSMGRYTFLWATSLFRVRRSSGVKLFRNSPSCPGSARARHVGNT